MFHLLGDYEVELAGHFDGLTVKGGQVTLTRQGMRQVHIESVLRKEKGRIRVTKNTHAFILDSPQSDSRIIDAGQLGTIIASSRLYDLYQICFDTLKEPLWIPFDFVEPFDAE